MFVAKVKGIWNARVTEFKGDNGQVYITYRASVTSLQGVSLLLESKDFDLRQFNPPDPANPSLVEAELLLTPVVKNGVQKLRVDGVGKTSVINLTENTQKAG